MGKIILQGKFSKTELPFSKTSMEDLKKFEASFDKLLEILNSFNRYFEQAPFSENDIYTFSFKNDDAASLAYSYCICELQFAEQHHF